MSIIKILSIIDSLREGWYNPPISYYSRKKTTFEHQSYMRSAIDELKMYLMEHENENAISVIEEFRKTMDIFSCKAKTEESKNMFSIYYDVATDVLDCVLCPEE